MEFSQFSLEGKVALVTGGSRGTGEATAKLVRGLSDEQLDKSAVLLGGLPAMTAEQAVGAILIGNAAGHFDSIKTSS